MNLVREKLALPVSDSVLERLLSQLKFSTEQCPTEGDYWYYRARIEQKLHKPARDVKYSMDKAGEYNSAALSKNIDPFALAAPPHREEDKLPPYVREKWALVVGVGEFQDHKRIRQLSFTAKDAVDFANVLKDEKYGRFKADNVKVLTDRQATRRNIDEGIGWLRANAKREDLIVIYMSSHGSQRAMDPNGVSYIIAHDTDTQNAASLYASSIQMIDLVQDIKTQIQAQRAVLILDTCYSGDAASLNGSKTLAVEQDISAYNGALKSLSSRAGRVVITSSKADEQSWEDPQLRNSVFTYYLKQALRENAGQQNIDAVFGYVSKQVSAISIEKGRSQNPMIEKSRHGGEIVIGVQTEDRAHSPAPAAPGISNMSANAKDLFYNPATGAKLKQSEMEQDESTGLTLARRVSNQSAKYPGIHYRIELQAGGFVTDNHILGRLLIRSTSSLSWRQITPGNWAPTS